MRIFKLNDRGFTITEVIFVAVMTSMIVAAILSGWIFTHKTFSGERYHTEMRVDLLETIETMKNDIRLTSATYMSFYPADSGTYTAVSMPLAEVDSNGLYTIDSNGYIVWDKTVFYHTVTESGLNKLKKTVKDSWDSSLDEDERYTLLSNVVSGSETGDSTETLIGENLKEFEIEPLSPSVDFYTDSSTAIKSPEVVFGYIKISSGDHTLRFTVTGKSDSSSGYAFGIDNVRIDPSNSPRDAEYYDSSYAPGGMISSSGKTITRVHDTQFSNENYLDYAASVEDDYIEFTDYYDLWRDSSFSNASLDNVFLYGDEARAKLETPEDRAAMDKEDIVWDAFSETGDSEEFGHDGNFPSYPITVRTILTKANIDTEGVTASNPVRGDLLRIKFTASDNNPIKISAAYITRRNGTSGEDGLVNQSPSGQDPEDYHFHQQLYFQDVFDGDDDGDTTEILEEAWIPEGESIWSEWVGFPLRLEDSGSDVDYFITFSVPDLASVSFPSGWTAFDPAQDEAKYWDDSNSSNVNTYYITSGSYTTVLLPAAGTPVWSGAYTVNTYDDIFTSSSMDVWRKKGTVESKIFNTQIDNPNYNEIKWSEDSPTGTEISIKARSSDDSNMVGASDWSSISSSTANPTGLSIGSGRYLQYYADITTVPYWKWSSGTLSYSDYITEQLGLSNPYDFPDRSGEPLTAGVTSVWMDDVETDWPGEDVVCIIKADIAKKDDYGQVTCTVDGLPLTRVLNVTVGLEKEFQGRTFSEENTFEVESRNTGK